MKALLIHEFGAPSHTVIENATLATPGMGEVAVRIEASSVNPLDLKMLAGYMQSTFPVAFPYILGTDLAGVIDAIGPNVENFKLGDRVVGRLNPTAGGAFAESAVIPAKDLCVIPTSMSFEQAAALPTAAGTAWLALFNVGSLLAGQRVLIHAAAGGVGSFAVQFAKQAGAYVIATASAKNHSLIKELGADETIDYRQQDFSTQVQDIDLVLDTVGSDTLERSWQVVKANGHIVSTVDYLIKPQNDKKGSFAFFNTDASSLKSIIKRFEAKRLQVILDTIHPLDEARTALEQVAGGHARGKVIIRPSR